MDAKIKQSNPIVDNVVSRIQNSLSKLQSAINNNKAIVNYNTNNNIRQNLFDSKDYNIKEKNRLLSETSMHGQIPIGYSMFNDESIIATDERNNKAKLNYENIINNNNIQYESKTNRDNKTNSKKRDYFIDNDNMNNSVGKWKCLNCGNINLLHNTICINCGQFKSQIRNKINDDMRYDKSHENNIINYIDSPYAKNDKDINNNYNIKGESSNEKESKYNYENITYIQDQKKIYNKPSIEYNAPNNMGLFNPLTKSESNLIDPNYINNFNLTEIIYNTNRNKKDNTKKISDLYLYGDYLEGELKESNDENIKLLEKYKNNKNEIHKLSQINTKIKQKIDELQKKDIELKKLNSQLKNGFSLFQKKYDNNMNNFEIENTDNINLLKKLELTNKNNIEIQNNYEREIENIKQKILMLTDEEEENDEQEKELENIIEKEKKEIEENNDKYIFLLKENELLNQDIEKLQKKIDLNKINEDEEKTIEDPIQKISVLKNNIKLFDKEINENKIIIKDLINEYKILSENNKANINNDNYSDNQEEDDKNEYLLYKEKNNKISSELSKLKDITNNLSESKDKIISIYEGEITKLKDFYVKAKEKTMNILEKENDMNEIEENNLMKMHEENENIKNENYELIKNLDQLPQLQLVYQGLLEENKTLKAKLYGNELTREKQNLLQNSNNDEEANEE
jgi:hypothetical protein